MTQTFYRYQRNDGTFVIVDSLSKLPPEARSKAQPVSLDAAPSESVEEGSGTAGIRTLVPRSIPGGPFQFDALSFGLGFGGGVLLSAMVIVVLRRITHGGAVPRRLFVVFIVLGLTAGLGSAYLGWLRRTTGQSDESFASPARIVDDARKAADRVRRARKEQETQLEEIEKLSQ